VKSKTRKALVVQLGSLTRVVPSVGDPYWLDSSRDGEIGRDDPDEDIVHWARVTRGRLAATESVTTTNDMLELLQRVINVGLATAGIVDVPPKR
jgi:hypothetical protein